MNSDVGLISDLRCANRLSLNVWKTEFVIFRSVRSNRTNRVTLKLINTTIFESSKINYLGVILDPNLCWKHHIFEKVKQGIRFLIP